MNNEYVTVFKIIEWYLSVCESQRIIGTIESFVLIYNYVFQTK